MAGIAYFHMVTMLPKESSRSSDGRGEQPERTQREHQMMLCGAPAAEGVAEGTDPDPSAPPYYHHMAVVSQAGLPSLLPLSEDFLPAGRERAYL